MYEKLLKIITNLDSPHVLVVGDFMLDVYTYGDALRISPEAPVQVLKVCRTEYACGGAGSVATDLADLGAVAICIGTIGKDHNAEIMKGMLDKSGIDTTGLITVDDRPTTTKQRLIGLAQHRHRQQLIRIDEESDDNFSDEQYEKILKIYAEKLGQAQVVCLQDYNKGIITPVTCQQMIKLAKDAGKKVLVDPALTSDYCRYMGASLITPNRKEASAAVGFEIETHDQAAKAAKKLAEELRLEAVVITLDKEGAYLKTKDIDEIIPTHPRSVYDVTGAGDIVLAALAATLACGCDYKSAMEIANIAAGIQVEKFGAASVSVDEIINQIIAEKQGKTGKILAVDALLNELNWHRTRGGTVVFTNGCFDILHRGHIEFLEFCKAQADVLVVGLNSDTSVKAIKGPERPINNQYDRESVLAALASVDYITVFEEPDPLNLIKKVKPNVLVKGSDWAEKGVVGREIVEAYGGKVVLAPLVEGKSSTSVIEKLKSVRKKKLE